MEQKLKIRILPAQKRRQNLNIEITAEHLSIPDSWPPLKGRKGKITFLLNIAQSILRVSDSPDIAKTFPLGAKFREQDYIFSCVKIGGKYLHGAVPADVSEKLVALARQHGAKVSAIAGFGLVEHRLIEKNCGSSLRTDTADKLLIFIAQAPGVRLLVMDGEPFGCYFFSNNPEYREQELKRIIDELGLREFSWAVYGGADGIFGPPGPAEPSGVTGSSEPSGQPRPAELDWLENFFETLCLTAVLVSANI